MKKQVNRVDQSQKVLAIICGQESYSPIDFSLREVALIALNSQTPPPAKEAALVDLHALLDNFEKCMACAKERDNPADLQKWALEKAAELTQDPKEIAQVLNQFSCMRNKNGVQLMAEKLTEQITLEVLAEIDIMHLYFSHEKLSKELSQKAIELAWDDFDALANLHCFGMEDIGERLWELAQTAKEKRVALSKHQGTPSRKQEKIRELILMETDVDWLLETYQKNFLQNEDICKAVFGQMQQVFKKEDWELVLRKTQYDNIRLGKVRLEAIRQLRDSLDANLAKEVLAEICIDEEIAEALLEILAINAKNEEEINFVFSHKLTTSYVRELCVMRNIELKKTFANHPNFLPPAHPELTSAQESTSQNALPSSTIVETNAEFIQTTPDSLAQKRPEEVPQGNKFSKWLSGLRRIF